MTEEKTTPVATPRPRSLQEAVTYLSRAVKRIISIRQLHGEFAVNPSRISDAMQIRTGETPAEGSYGESKMRVVVGFALEAVPKPGSVPEITVVDSTVDPEEAPVYVGASFEVVYDVDLKGGDSPSVRELLAFGEVNGRFNAFSYWREFVQSSLSRAGPPPYVLPPFNANARLMALDKKDPANKAE
jgi:hypothetical protein